MQLETATELHGNYSFRLQPWSVVGIYVVHGVGLYVVHGVGLYMVHGGGLYVVHGVGLYVVHGGGLYVMHGGGLYVVHGGGYADLILLEVLFLIMDNQINRNLNGRESCTYILSGNLSEI